MDFRTLLAVLGSIGGGIAWAGTVETRLTRIEAVERRIDCELERHGQVLNWLVSAAEANANRRPLPERVPVIADRVCGRE